MQQDQFEVKFPLKDFLPPRNSAKRIVEPSREIPVLTECDVAVLGGGPAGVCAAAAAARAGRSVVLVERHGFLGGMATAGWVTTIHTLYGTDRKTKVIGGLAEEFVRRLQRRGAVRNSEKDGETGDWTICCETARFVCDDMVIGSGARLLSHTTLVAVLRDGRRIRAAIVEGKSGRQAVLANVFIDCTGDADLARRAGLTTQVGDAQGKCQGPTLVFRVGGKARGAMPLWQVQRELYKTPMDYNGDLYPCFLWGAEGVWNRSEQMMAGTRVLNVNAADSFDFTRAEVEARYQLRWVLDRLKTMPGWENAYLLSMAAQIGVRETHRIVAHHQLTREELLTGKPFEDAIAQGTYPVDIHEGDKPGITFEHLDGRARHFGGDMSVKVSRWDGQPEGAPPRDTLCWQVPYRSLVPRDMDNVLSAGRCIGADCAAAGAIRVMINCMQFGQAAGQAAAMTGPGGSVRDVDVRRLQNALIDAGMPLRV
jgi:hypothetical protein